MYLSPLYGLALDVDIVEEEVGEVGSQIRRGSGGDWVANSRLVGNYKGKEYIQWLGKEYQ